MIWNFPDFNFGKYSMKYLKWKKTHLLNNYIICICFSDQTITCRAFLPFETSLIQFLGHIPWNIWSGTNVTSSISIFLVKNYISDKTIVYKTKTNVAWLTSKPSHFPPMVIMCCDEKNPEDIAQQWGTNTLKTASFVQS